MPNFQRHATISDHILNFPNPSPPSANVTQNNLNKWFKEVEDDLLRKKFPKLTTEIVMVFCFNFYISGIYRHFSFIVFLCNLLLILIIKTCHFTTQLLILLKKILIMYFIYIK